MAVTIAISLAMITLGIYFFGEYGLAMFVITPFFLGTCVTILYGFKKNISAKEATLLSFSTLGMLALFLVVFAVEGVICIIMAFPITLAVTWLGSVLGRAILNQSPDKGPLTIIILIILIPSYSFIEQDSDPALTSVTTAIEINASPEVVWENVLSFPELKEPTEFIFQTGIAYPINARLEGTGVGAIRHCNFTTGSFVEPITIWNEPNLLKFDVKDQPAPMKEMSFWDIDAPHLHDYFVSKEGQFKLTKLPNGNTLLEGTTWYYHNIRPVFYWKLWSDHIIHKIHLRVLEHIKENAEEAEQGTNDK